jgi:hypothetical protein
MLIKVKIPPHLIFIIHKYLQNSTFFVIHKNPYSILRPIQTEVPQGQPTIFNIYINNIPSVQNDSNVAILIYADDTNISKI